MKYPVLSDDEIKKQSNRLLAAGDADFTVNTAIEMTSKNGKPMIKVGLKVWDQTGAQGFVHDYLILTEAFAWKLKHFFESIGRGFDYATGEINPAEFVNANGRCILKIEKGTDQFPDDKNTVKDYIGETAKMKTEKTNQAFRTLAPGEPPMFTDDDIPFV